VQNLLSACTSVQAALHALVSHPDGILDMGGHPQIAPLLARIRAHAAQVEEICARQRNTPAALPTPSRRAYQWLKYLSVPENLLAQVATMAEARQIIAQLQWLTEGDLARYSFTFELSHGSYLYNTRPLGGTHAENPKSEHAPSPRIIRIAVAQGFSGAPPEILEALIKASLSRRQRKARALVTAYVSGEDYAETALGFELAAELAQAEGIDVRRRRLLASSGPRSLAGLPADFSPRFDSWSGWPVRSRPR